MKGLVVHRAGHSVTNRLRALLRRVANALVSPLEATVATAESPLAGGPVFIVGAPRSGSTLLYQLVTAAFDVGYLTNRHCNWYRAPVLVERWRATPFDEVAADFTSEHGATAGPHAPSECGNYWYRFLPRRPHTLGADSIRDASLKAMRAAVGGLATTIGRPLVFKNLILSLRIPLLVAAFPRALFIVMCRDAAETAVSILRAREKIYGSLDRWFSVRPASCELTQPLGDPFNQVVEQVLGTYSEIQRARLSCGENRFVDVSYERLCRAPAHELDGLQEALHARGLDIPRRTQFVCPDRFEMISRPSDVPSEWQRSIEDALHRRLR